MDHRPDSNDSSLGLTELMAWVAGLAGLVGLVVEVIRLSSREPSVAPIGFAMVLYVAYVAFSVSAFWNMPRVAIPVTMFVAGALWTLALHQIARSSLPQVLAWAIFIPLATAYTVRLIGPIQAEAGSMGKAARPSLAHTLLDKGMKFGNRPDRWRQSFDDSPEIEWVEPRPESFDLS